MDSTPTPPEKRKDKNKILTSKTTMNQILPFQTRAYKVKLLSSRAIKYSIAKK